MILLIGLILGLGCAIAIYFLRQWFLAFRPQTESGSNSTSKQPGYTQLISVLFYLIILQLSYIELLLEMYQDRKSNKTQQQNLKAGLGYEKISNC